MKIAILIIIAIVVFVCAGCRISCSSKFSGYELTDTAFDTCQKDCFNRGYDNELCADPQILTECIANLEKLAGDPSRNTIQENYSLTFSSDLEKLCAAPSAVEYTPRQTYYLCKCRSFTGDRRENCVNCILGRISHNSDRWDLFDKCTTDI